MPLYTGLQLRNGVTSSEDVTGSVTFSLPNNSSAATYFVIEGKRYWDGTTYKYQRLFGEKESEGTIISASNCTFVTGAINAAFIIPPNVTSSFTYSLNGDITISKSLIEFKATNALVYNIFDPTSSGSIFGIKDALITSSEGGGTPPDPRLGFLILTENGDALLKEDGEFLIQEQADSPPTPDFLILTERGDALLKEDGEFLIQEQAL